MRTIQDCPKPDSDSDSSGSDESSNFLIEWEADISDDIRTPNITYIKGDWSNLDSKQIIKLANDKFPLKNIINLYHIDFIENYSPSGWTHKCSCPFPDHQDSSPSFSYNSIEDRFNCFGCGRGGRAVQFKAYIENKNQVIAAIQLLESITNSDNAYEEVQDSPDNRIDRLLVSFSAEIREFITSHPSKQAIDFAVCLSQYVDMYLLKNSICIDYKNLEGAIDIIKRKISDYDR